MLKRVILLVLVLNAYMAVNTDTQSNLRSNVAACSEVDGPCHKVDQVMDPVEPIAPEDPCSPIVLYSDVVYNDICTADTPCERCMGECDADTDCAGSLLCHQRDGYARVPGCLSFGPGDYADYDYCYDPQCTVIEDQVCGPLPLTSLEQANGVCTDETPCGQCNGECDSDSHCEGAMICFQRDGNTKVPGCTSGGDGDFADYDYCVHPECEAAETVETAKCRSDKVNPTITYKSVPGAEVEGGSTEEWRARMDGAQSSPPGTCEVSLTELTGLHNRGNCPGGTDRAFYYQYTVTFDLCEAMAMSWQVPVDAGMGGVSVMDGVEVARYDDDMWGTFMINFDITLDAGQHTYEQLGGEVCCDGQTTWTVNGRSLSLEEMRSW